MNIVAYRDRNNGQYPLSEFDIRLRFNGGLPAELTKDEYDLLKVDPVYQTAQPQHNSQTHYIVETEPVFNDDKWFQNWRIEDAPPPPVPYTITMRQARLILNQVGLLDDAESKIANLTGQDGRTAQIEWEFASEIRRDHPLILQLANDLQLTSDQVDDMFRQASEL